METQMNTLRVNYAGSSQLQYTPKFIYLGITGVINTVVSGNIKYIK